MKVLHKIIASALLLILVNGTFTSCINVNALNIPMFKTTSASAPDTTPASVPDGVKLYEDINIGKAGDRDLYTSIAVPENVSEKPMPVAIYIHGGGWDKGSRKESLGTICGYVSKKGYIGVSLDYRLTGEAPYPAQIEDVKLAIRYLRGNAEKYNIDADRIGVWGSSAGAHLAALLGVSGDNPSLEGTGGWQEYSDTVQAVVDNYGPTDNFFMRPRTLDIVKALMGGKTTAQAPDLAKMAMPGTYLSPDDAPFIIRHGSADKMVPYKDSDSFAKKLKDAGIYCDFEIIDKAGHAFKDHPEEQKINDDEWAFMDKFVKGRMVTEHIVYKPITLDNTSLSINTNEFKQLAAKINRNSLKGKNIAWIIEDNSIVSIDGYGETVAIKGKAPGKTKIKAVVTEQFEYSDVKYNNEYAAVCEVTVAADDKK